MGKYQIGRDIESLSNRLSLLEKASIGDGRSGYGRSTAKIGYFGKIDQLEFNQFQWQPYAIRHQTFGYGIMAIQLIGDGVEIRSTATDSGGITHPKKPNAQGEYVASQTEWTGDPDGPHHLSKIRVWLAGPNRDRYDIFYQVSYQRYGQVGPVSNGTQIESPGDPTDQIYSFSAWILPKQDAK